MNAGGKLRQLCLAALVVALLLLAGCGGKKQARVKAPPPPDMTAGTSVEERPAATESEAATADLRDAKPIYVETGIASWYGPPYHNRRAANGEIFDMNGMTAAHRTLPLNSVARVTNVKTGSSTVVRITDRGPFVEGRMLDLSAAAAKKVDVWRPGLARVRLEVLEAPAAIEHGGRWCVQFGAFTSMKEATKFKERLQRRYTTANVLQFTGPTGDWVRVRVKDDDKKRAQKVLNETEVPEGAAFLVRLD
ncbi:MAG: septal ring lytic transglycosylase RlpA family protein [Terriglobales bacterium]